MQFTYFKFRNFKGIHNEILDFRKNPSSKVYTLVGLNESGKTTILEAINYFLYNSESLAALDLDNYKVEDIHSLIPINKRDNFNEEIEIEAGFEYNNEDIIAIRNAFLENKIKLARTPKMLCYTQKYSFKNSIHQPDLLKNNWENDFYGFVGKATKPRKLKNSEALIAHEIIKKRMPSILYFPNFLFEFPDKIFLESVDAKHKYYRTVIQDVLDSLDNNTNVEEHLIKRIKSNDTNEKRNLRILIGKMEKQLTSVIFGKWNQIFNKQITKAEIVLDYDNSEKGPSLEFNIKDDVDTYRIVERSLGFRWFFVYIFLTQFRSFRKAHNNAFFLFDEPAYNLHPSAQLELLKSFERLPKVLYTTHSHYLINPKWLENTYVIKNEGIDYLNEEHYKSKNTDIRIHKYREFAVKHPNQTSYFQPILEVLDYRPSNLELIPQAIITEGKNDFYTFNYFQTVIKNEPKPLHFIPGTSSSNLESLISMYLGWGKKFLVLLDSDTTQKQRYENIFGRSISESIITYSDINPLWTNFATEDLYLSEDRLAIQKQYYPSENLYNKKLFNRSIQELFITNATFNFSNETKENIEKVISYLRKKLI